MRSKTNQNRQNTNNKHLSRLLYLMLTEKTSCWKEKRKKKLCSWLIYKSLCIIIKWYVAGFGRGNSIDVWCTPGIAYNSIDPIAHVWCFKKKEKKMFANVTFMLHRSVEVSLEMFLNFGQLCGFEIYGGTEWAVKITAAFMTYLQKVQG